MADDIAYTSVDAESPISNMVTGVITAVAGSAAIDVPVGFIPKKVELIINGTTDKFISWYDSCGTGGDWLLVTSTPSLAVADTGGIATLAQTATVRAGFTIPAAMLTASDVVHFIAYR